MRMRHKAETLKCLLKPVVGKLVRKGGALVMEIPKGCKVEPEDIARAIRAERDNR